MELSDYGSKFSLTGLIFLLPTGIPNPDYHVFKFVLGDT